MATLADQPTFAASWDDDLDIIRFTKRLDTLLASASGDYEEAVRLPAALELLSRDDHFSPEFQNKLVKVLDLIHRSSVETLHRLISDSKNQLKELNSEISGPIDSSGFNRASTVSERQRRTDDRDQLVRYIADLEAKRKQKDKFPTRSTLQTFTNALEEAKVAPEFYVLALKNGFGTSATLRKILQSLLALWGFENQQLG